MQFQVLVKPSVRKGRSLTGDESLQTDESVGHSTFLALNRTQKRRPATT